ncbi:rard protein [Variovorax atrisoli]|uniref:rard protein n=1 Tax=Variovorax atrisoli TaxID=3394203 RepID=UPI0033938989
MPIAMNRPRRVLLALALSFVAAGVLSPVVPQMAGKPYSAIDVAHALLIGALSYTWCRAEGLERGVAPPGRSALLAGLFPILGVPIYFFRTRSFAKALVATLAAAAFLVACTMLSGLCAIASAALLGRPLPT